MQIVVLDELVQTPVFFSHYFLCSMWLCIWQFSVVCV